MPFRKISLITSAPWCLIVVGCLGDGEADEISASRDSASNELARVFADGEEYCSKQDDCDILSKFDCLDGFESEGRVEIAIRDLGLTPSQQRACRDALLAYDGCFADLDCEEAEAASWSWWDSEEETWHCLDPETGAEIPCLEPGCAREFSRMHESCVALFEYFATTAG